MQLDALFRLGFPSAPYLKYLTLLHIVTRWLVLQKASRHTYKVLRPLVGTRFQVLFHSPSGVLFTFPSRYSFTIGRQEYLALDGGPPSFPHERPSTWYSGGRSRRSLRFRLRGSHPLWPAVPGQLD